MKALLIREPAAQRPLSEVLVFDQHPDPAASASGQARIRTLATALNHLDLWVARGLPWLNIPYPHISGSDACGVVESVGPDVDPAWVGKRVILNAAIASSHFKSPRDSTDFTLAPDYYLLGEHIQGVHAEFFIAPVNNLAVVNDSADPVLAAAFGLTFLTAYSMMVGKAGLRSGQHVLITGIGGGVALAALAIAKHFGCRVCVTSRHAWKLDKAATLGADECVIDTGQDWSKQVREWTAKRGVDIAVDSSGKATHLKCLKSLARGGTYVTPGCTSGPDATTDLARIFWNQLRILGSTMGSNDEFAEITALFNKGKLTPIVDQVFPADQGVKAFERLDKGEQFGKLVLKWD